MTTVDLSREWERAGVPVGDRDAWASVLLRYPCERVPRDYPGEEDTRAAVAARQRGDIADDHDSVHRYAWSLCVAREGTGLLTRADTIEVAGYLQHGGTLTEANGYLDAVADAVTPTADWWPFFARSELSFHASRFEQYRRIGCTPTDLAQYVASALSFTGPNDVLAFHRLWRTQVCPDAPWPSAIRYRRGGWTDDEIKVWEARRLAGEDVDRALDTMLALTRD